MMHRCNIGCINPNTSMCLSCHARACMSWKILRICKLFWNPLTPVGSVVWTELGVLNLRSRTVTVLWNIVVLWCGGPAVKSSKEIFFVTLNYLLFDSGKYEHWKNIYIRYWKNIFFSSWWHWILQKKIMVIFSFNQKTSTLKKERQKQINKQ